MNRVLKLCCLFSMFLVVACSPNPDEVKFDAPAITAEITSMLHIQDAAWNAGDIDEFMDYYLKSDDLRFASGGNTNRGWQATLDGYKNRYPNTDAMGKLSFSDIEIKVLSPEYAQVFGRWQLVRKLDKPGGLFTLLVQNIDGEWVIISDHTSSN